MSNEALTPRQYEIALLICDHFTYDEIGERLGISGSTVKAQANTIRLKLGVEKKRQIPAMMKKLGMVE